MMFGPMLVFFQVVELFFFSFSSSQGSVTMENLDFMQFIFAAVLLASQHVHSIIVPDVGSFHQGVGITNLSYTNQDNRMTNVHPFCYYCNNLLLVS